MVAMAIIISAVMAMTIAIVMRYISQVREEQYLRIYHQSALNLAQAGFTEAQAYFIRREKVAFADTYTLTTYTANNNPFYYPDYAFKPLYSTISKDSDTEEIGPASYRSNPDAITYESGNTIASAIVRTIPLTDPYGNTDPSKGLTNKTWGRYVVERQWPKNWSPFGNSMSAITDPLAVHDLSQARAEGAAIGAGLVWGISSRAYVYRNDVSLTASDAAAFNQGDINEAPLRQYQGRRLLLAQATVYGELVGLSLWVPSSRPAVWLRTCSSLSVGTKGKVDKGGTGSAVVITRNDSSTCPSSGVNGSVDSSKYDPTLGLVFSGFTLTDLKNAADRVNEPGQNPVTLFPVYADSGAAGAGYQAAVSKGTFYFLEGNATFPDRSSNKYQSALAGTGMLFVNGNLTVASGHNGWWNGIIVVNGNASLSDPCDISGMIILLNNGSLTITGNTKGSYASVLRSPTAVDLAMKFFTNYRLNKATIQYQVK
jgi:hypothetical protein